jgi:zinc transporter, ZIP family
VEARGQAAEPVGESPLRRIPAWALAVGALVAIAAVLTALAIAGGDTLPDRTGPPVEELAVERTVLEPNSIELTLRNTGPDAVSVAQAFVNDAYVDFESSEQRIGRLGSETVTLAYPWNEGQPYLVSLVTSTGAVIEHEIEVAVETPSADGGFFGLMALLGTYVGIIPVVLGMLLLPAMRRFRPAWIRVLLALTVGLLGFLAIDGALEALDLAAAGGGAFGGAELVFLGAGLAFLALIGLDRHLQGRARTGGGDAAPGRGLHLALMIAIGIGLHNLGEGLAIGSAYAVGELALGAFLVVGFAIHNTTEGIAIVAPLARLRPSIWRLLALGLIAGAPAILGAVVGASIDNAELSALLIGVGVGAIAQVIVQIWPALRDSAGRVLDATTALAMGAGALILYATGLLVSV